MDNDVKFSELKPKVALAVAAHPDDLDFGCSATFAKWASEGTDCYYLILTNGNKGSEDKSMTSEELIKVRRDEQRNAAKGLGVKEVFFLDYDDGALEVTQQAKKDVVRYIRKLKPEVVVTFDPTLLYVANRGMINHTDHRAAGQITVDAVFPLARDRLTFPELESEGLECHKTKTLLLVNFEKANYFVDISNFLEKKVDALKAHKSQVGDIDRVRGWVTQNAETQGAKIGVKYAEGFIRLDLMG